MATRNAYFGPVRMHVGDNVTQAEYNAHCGASDSFMHGQFALGGKIYFRLGAVTYNWGNWNSISHGTYKIIDPDTSNWKNFYPRKRTTSGTVTNPTRLVLDSDEYPTNATLNGVSMELLASINYTENMYICTHVANDTAPGNSYQMAQVWCRCTGDGGTPLTYAGSDTVTYKSFNGTGLAGKEISIRASGGNARYFVRRANGPAGARITTAYLSRTVSLSVGTGGTATISATSLKRGGTATINITSISNGYTLNSVTATGGTITPVTVGSKYTFTMATPAVNATVTVKFKASVPKVDQGDKITKADMDELRTYKIISGVTPNPNTVAVGSLATATDGNTYKHSSLSSGTQIDADWYNT